ncbi:MAG: AzlC family ABC transporter permease, partial [bacterium]|nr:AzlC family ABC transporter permease [bacterium]
MRLLRTALAVASPIMMTYAVLGFGYGMFAASSGLSLLYPIVMAAGVYSGSVEFMMVTMLGGAFDPVGVFVMAFLVGARHLFYGISMLDRYKGAGWKKVPLIFMMSDETFAITWGGDEPPQVNRHDFLLAVAFLDWIAWQLGVFAGAGLGNSLGLCLPELDFFMVASFTAIFTEQWLSEKNHFSSVLGLVAGIPMVWLFGPSEFMLPAMGIIVTVLVASRRWLERRID